MRKISAFISQPPRTSPSIWDAGIGLTRNTPLERRTREEHDLVRGIGAGSRRTIRGVAWVVEKAMSASSAREQVSFLVFSASLRRGSLNTRLAALAAGA